MHLADLVLRRGDYAEERGALELITTSLEEVFGWDALRRDRELARLQAALECMHMRRELPVGAALDGSRTEPAKTDAQPAARQRIDGDTSETADPGPSIAGEAQMPAGEAAAEGSRR